MNKSEMQQQLEQVNKFAYIQEFLKKNNYTFVPPRQYFHHR